MSCCQIQVLIPLGVTLNPINDIKSDSVFAATISVIISVKSLLRYLQILCLCGFFYSGFLFSSHILSPMPPPLPLDKKEFRHPFCFCFIFLLLHAPAISHQDIPPARSYPSIINESLLFPHLLASS